ncbi:acyl dehydratase [Tepidamorphus gemmatus]|uniref:Acyl dehydratase n=1 Tax=Tepidamorphus gemmatus TaxID=747076 RepID=A0A4R3MAT1_9HYPH|nr:MaoC family dehydratase [Tepidamorphus gemmatus]TCT09813.1 acyl dehydratase [Tepidamorphus gemmatus]
MREAVEYRGPRLAVGEFEALVGCRIGASRWITVDQATIDTFADLTGDHQFIHVDPDRARATPFGTTIAHGFLTLSLMGGLATEIMPQLAGAKLSINYGFDRLRFVAPVRSGARVRSVLGLKALDTGRPDFIECLFDASLEIEDEAKPAIVADWRTRAYL